MPEPSDGPVLPNPDRPLFGRPFGWQVIDVGDRDRFADYLRQRGVEVDDDDRGSLLE